MRQIYPSTFAVRMDAYSVFVAWALAVACVILWALVVFLKLPFGCLLGFAGKAFLGAAAVHVALAFTHKCPVCGKRPTVQGFKPPHPDSQTQSKFTGWAGVVVSVVRRSEFTCIHCGTNFFLKNGRT
ncbi:hypothetical protein [Rhodoferax sp.]|uniref:hypothetical protein n=1 Tax=Rhodoferax sp. TaxID=50421 RepID=UPI002ACEBAF7|nr:hypothetical protein [Rhodoferax sp.]MDZ7919718.1 hypothetical protein [Rhodoferax sp.]